MEKSVYIAHGDNGLIMAKQLLESAHISLPQGASIALKPNFVVSRPAEQGATTHPSILAGIIEYLLDHGHRDISIMESAWIGDSTQKAFSTLGIIDMAKKYGIMLYDLKEDATIVCPSPIGELTVCARPYKSDILINIPVLKGHCQTKMTCCLKNMKGLIPDSEKRRYHTMGLHGPIAALNTIFRPHLHIIDNICGDLGFEEGGNPTKSNRMLLGFDPVMLDSFACDFIGIDIAKVPYISLAESYGLGSADLTNLQNIIIGEEKTRLDKPSQEIDMSTLHAKLHSKSTCSACYANALVALKELYMIDAQAFSHLPPLHIGQGFLGTAIDGMGIGNCAAKSARHVPGCPPETANILTFLQKNSPAKP